MTIEKIFPVLSIVLNAGSVLFYLIKQDYPHPFLKVNHCAKRV
jgi:hypothetical protein